jgi:hypothetical protein
LVAGALTTTFLVRKNRNGTRGSSLNALKEAKDGTSISPTATPTRVPSQAPSTSPSASPSTTPSISPTIAPTSAVPTQSPSNTPTTLSSNFAFRLKLYWEQGYFWQEETIEREWCLECTTCDVLTASDTGAGCRDSAKDDTTCKAGDQLWIQTCSPNEGGNAIFSVVSGPHGEQIKIHGTNLCMERVDIRLIQLNECDDQNIVRDVQLWDGFKQSGPFQLAPRNHDGVCMSQHHHPKPNELVYTEVCRIAHFWDTGYWQALSV